MTVSELTDFMKQIQAQFEAQAAAHKDAINTAVESAVKAAVSAVAPSVAPIANLVIDGVDSYVLALLGESAPASAVAAPTDPASQIKQLQQHVAALTVATVGKATSLPTLKAQASVAVPVIPATADESAAA